MEKKPLRFDAVINSRGLNKDGDFLAFFSSPSPKQSVSSLSLSLSLWLSEIADR